MTDVAERTDRAVNIAGLTEKWLAAIIAAKRIGAGLRQAVTTGIGERAIGDGDRLSSVTRSQMPTASLQGDLERQIQGEVRFDRITRALYSTDASVYQIEPLGVVIPRTRDDVVRAVAIARRHRVSITARGGGTSQAGQAIGAGLQIDTSKYFNRLLEINAAER